jgi:hypothetical protein
MPYFPAGGGVGYHAPSTQFWRPQGYRQPAATSRHARMGQSLSDILGTISNVAGDVSSGLGSAGPGANYYTSGGGSYYSPPSPAPARSFSSGMSSTTLLLGAAALGGIIYFASKR